MAYPNRAAKKKARQEQVAANQKLSKQERRKARRGQAKAAKPGAKPGEKPAAAKPAAATDPWGPPLGGGAGSSGPFDNDPNTMFSYFNPPQTFDFSEDRGATAAGNFNDPYNAYLSAIPVMQRQTRQSIQDSLAGFGAGGNRYSSAAMDTAARIGAESAERQNAMLSDLLYNQTNADLDRQMMAAQGYINASPQVEDAMQSRLGFNYQMANAQQDQLNREAAFRQQQQAAARAAQNQAYSRWNQNKYGNLPFLTQFLSQGIGQGPEPIFQTTGGKEGARDTVMDMAKLYAMYSQE